MAEWSKGEKQGMRAGGRRGQVTDRKCGALRPWQGPEQERHWRFLSGRNDSVINKAY